MQLPFRGHTAFGVNHRERAAQRDALAAPHPPLPSLDDRQTESVTSDSVAVGSVL